MTPWRNGSASDSRSEGCVFKSRRGQTVFFLFFCRQILYSAPEVYLDGPNSTFSDPKADIWSLGIILIELILDRVLWKSLKLSQKIRKILSLIQCNNSSVFERIAREHSCYGKFEVVTIIIN
jgi:serine/threonine protein kinase